MTITDRRCPGGLEHEDRGGGGSVRLVLRAPGDGEHRAPGEPDRALPAGLAQGDVQLPVEHQEELVGVVMDMPDVLALDLGDAYVVVVDARDDAGAPQGVEGRQGLAEGDGFVAHEWILARWA
jgi:hypothetical protein